MSVYHHHRICPVCKELAEFIRMSRTKLVCANCNPIVFDHVQKQQSKSSSVYPKLTQLPGGSWVREITLPKIKRPSKRVTNGKR